MFLTRRAHSRPAVAARGVVARAIARAKPVVPEGAWPVLLSLRSLAGPGPVVGRPAFARVLVLAAHPDDESVGAAGTLALLADAGAEVRVVFATDGEATRGSALSRAETGALRRGEAEAACRVIGAGSPRFLGLADGGLTDQVPALAAAISSLVAELAPEVVFLPWWLDDHPDHRALSAALARAGAPGNLEVWGYETWTPLPANRIVDISEVLDRKRRALEAHVTAHLAFDVSAALGLARWRSIHGLMGRGHAEAFIAAALEDYIALMEAAISD
ncbi:MAG: PIG-L deacetylase family protein [Acidimicrobiales bacterium]